MKFVVYRALLYSLHPQLEGLQTESEYLVSALAAILMRPFFHALDSDAALLKSLVQNCDYANLHLHHQ